MKILFLIRTLNFGGAQRQLVTLVNRLVRDGHDVSLIVYYAGGALESLLDNRIGYYNLGKRGRWDLVSSYLRLLKIVAEKNPEILYSFLDTSNIISATLNIPFPRLKVVWGIRQSVMELEHYDWTRRWVSRLERWLSFAPDRIIFNSRSGKTSAIQCGYPDAKSRVIPNGIDTERFFPHLPDRIKIRSELNIPEQACLVGIVGRLDPMKDHVTFIKAASELAKMNSSVYFICVGSGNPDYKEELQALSLSMGLEKRLAWLGGRSDMQPLYNALDVLVSSSAFGEGFSNVIAEAMSCGIPCVVTDVGDARLIVGAFGAVIPPRNPQILSDTLREMVENLPSVQHHLIRQHIVDNFGVEAMVQATIDEFV
jgi:glycosyltransferase involved in cell wall biosynthesis